MNPKEQALAYIKSIAAAGTITKAEVVAAFDSGATPGGAAEAHKIGIAEILYYIGGAIVFVGISIFVYQNWGTLSFPTKMIATLGGGIASYIVGVLFSTNTKYTGPANAFYFISALVMPMGLYVVLDNAGFNVNSSGTQSLISFILLVVFGASFAIYRQTVFALFSIIFGTWLFYSVTNNLVVQSQLYDSLHFFEFRTLLSGATYILLGYAFAKTKLSSLTGALYAFGVMGFLGAALALGDWQPHQNIFWEFSFPLLVFGALYGSVYLKSKSFLTFGSLYLMAYIFKITAEYFTSGLGWPLSLVIAGLLMIAVGYLSLSLNKKYIAI